jgi:hypothetical protein
MVDNIDRENVEVAVNEYRELKMQKKSHDDISQDLLDDKLNELGEMVSLLVYQAEGPNEFTLDKNAVEALGGEHYEIKLVGSSAVLKIDAIDDDEDDDETSIPELTDD